MRFTLILQFLSSFVIAPHPPCYCDIYENGASINDNDMCKEFDDVEDEWVCLPMESGYGCAEDQIFCDNYNYPPPTPAPTPPTPVPTPSPTPVPTPVPTPSPTPVPTPVPTPSPTPVPTPSPTPSPTPEDQSFHDIEVAIGFELSIWHFISFLLVTTMCIFCVLIVILLVFIIIFKREKFGEKPPMIVVMLSLKILIKF